MTARKPITAREREIAIEAHLDAHDAKIAARAKARLKADARKKQRGLRAFIERLKA